MTVTGFEPALAGLKAQGPKPIRRHGRVYLLKRGSSFMGGKVSGRSSHGGHGGQAVMSNPGKASLGFPPNRSTIPSILSLSPFTKIR